jgi:hypothetical protein
MPIRKITKKARDLKPGDQISNFSGSIIYLVISNEDVGDDCLYRLTTIDQNNCISITKNGKYSSWIVLRND